MLKTPFWRQPSKSTRTSRTGAWTSTPQNPAFSKSLRAPQFRSTALHPPRAGVAESGWLSAPRRRAARREAPPHKSSSRRQLAGTLPQRPQSPACSQGEGSRWCGAQTVVADPQSARAGTVGWPVSAAQALRNKRATTAVYYSLARGLQEADAPLATHSGSRTLYRQCKPSPPATLPPPLPPCQTGVRVPFFFSLAWLLRSPSQTV